MLLVMEASYRYLKDENIVPSYKNVLSMNVYEYNESYHADILLKRLMYNF